MRNNKYLQLNKAQAFSEYRKRAQDIKNSEGDMPSDEVLRLSNGKYKSNAEVVCDCSLKTEEWMTTEEAAEFLRIPRASLLNLSSNGKVPYYKFQSRNRYRKCDLVSLLMSSRKGG